MTWDIDEADHGLASFPDHSVTWDINEADPGLASFPDHSVTWDIDEADHGLTGFCYYLEVACWPSACWKRARIQPQSRAPLCAASNLLLCRGSLGYCLAVSKATRTCRYIVSPHARAHDDIIIAVTMMICIEIQWRYKVHQPHHPQPHCNFACSSVLPCARTVRSY